MPLAVALQHLWGLPLSGDSDDTEQPHPRVNQRVDRSTDVPFRRVG